MRWVMLLACAMLATTALAGCGGKTGTGTDTSATGTTTGTGTPTGTKSGTSASTTSLPPGVHTAHISASAQTGAVPLNVTFGLSSSADAKSWRLSFGDGSAAITGNAPIPASKSYTYAVGGNFTASLNVTFADKRSAQDTIKITVTVSNGGPPPPSHFELGAAMGCENSIASAAGCISFKLGPSQTQAIDGFWVPLDLRYWGKSFTSTITPDQLGDSDCVFVAADLTTITGDGNNGASACAGTVPANTAWLFIYSYVEPETAIIIDFVV